jgi:hypothetical protein
VVGHPPLPPGGASQGKGGLLDGDAEPPHPWVGGGGEKGAQSRPRHSQNRQILARNWHLGIP